ncbi:MAG: single-stranded-DNA-specific exonuclease RecJ [Caldimicrobium sp.]
MENGRIWVQRSYSRDLFYHFLREGAFTPFLSRLLVCRGFKELKEAYTFLYPQLTDFSDPFQIPEMDEAVKKMAKALKEGMKIGIYGDSDVDGIFGTYILYNFLSLLTKENPIVLIPDKNKEGYGFHSKFLPFFKERGVKLLITVDVGVSSYETVENAKALGLEVIITDHHEILRKPDTLVISGKRTSLDSPFYHLCGAGVAFTLLRALRSYLHAEGFFSDKPLPPLRPYLELVAIATLADMVPLLGENRIITYYGFRDLSSPTHPSLKAFFQALGLKDTISEEELHFKIIPRLNACGRMGKPELLFHFLVERDKEELEKHLQELCALYVERQNLELELWQVIENTFILEDSSPILIGVFENIPKALLGLLANRAKNKFGKPVLIISDEGDLCYGSGRSPEELDLLTVLLPKRELFLELGGHKKAFGFQILKENLKPLQEYLLASEALQKIDSQKKFLFVDAETTLSELFVEENLLAFKVLPPYGIAHEPPTLLLKDFEIKEILYLKDRHTKLLLKEGLNEVYALCFNKMLEGNIKYLIGTPFINNFSQKLEIKVEDVK